MLHILYGNDTFARKEALAALKASLDTDGSLATNTATFDARQAAPQEVLAACDTVPFLADHRLVIVEGLLESAGKPKRTRKKAAASADAPPDDIGPWQALVDYVPRIPPSTTLVLIDDDVPGTNGLLIALSKHAEVERFVAPVRDADIAAWVGQRALKMGVRIDAPATKLLAELIGPEPWMVVKELEKLSAYANGAPIREPDVRELVSRAKEQKGYFLADAIVEGQGAKAARILHEMVEDGQSLGVILSTIAGRYRRIAVAKQMSEDGEPGTRIAARVGMKPNFALDKLLEQAQRRTWDDLRAAYHRLVQADLDVKRDSMDELLALELAVHDLAAWRPARATASIR